MELFVKQLSILLKVVLIHNIQQPFSDLPRGIVLLKGHQGPGATAIFEGTSSGPANTDRAALFRIKRQTLFDPDFMAPPIPEIILG